jgi:hypothetical protein
MLPKIFAFKIAPAVTKKATENIWNIPRGMMSLPVRRRHEEYMETQYLAARVSS